MKKILILGIAGQTGPYLTNLLKSSDYKVFGTVSKTSDYKKLFHLGIQENIEYLEDISFAPHLHSILSRVDPDIIVNLAAISSVLQCEQHVNKCWAINALAPNAILEWLTRPLNKNKVFCQVGSINVFEGNTNTIFIDESYPLNPQTIYAKSKAYAVNQVRLYRDVYGIKAINAILGPNESPSRPPNFFSSKVVNYFVNYKKTGEVQNPLYIGDLDVIRPWGHSEDYMAGLKTILESNRYEDFIISSDCLASTKDFIEIVCDILNIDLKWSEWFGYDARNNKVIIEQNKSLLRQNQTKILTVNNAKISGLGWAPKRNLYNIIEEMVNSSMGT